MVSFIIFKTTQKQENPIKDRDVIINFKKMVGLNYHLILFKTTHKQKNPILKKGPNTDFKKFLELNYHLLQFPKPDLEEKGNVLGTGGEILPTRT